MFVFVVQVPGSGQKAPVGSLEFVVNEVRRHTLFMTNPTEAKEMF